MLNILKNLFGANKNKIDCYFPNSDKIISDIDVSGSEYKSGLFEIEGIISPESQGGYPCDGYSVHMFKLAFWKKIEEAKVNQELLVLRGVNKNNYFDDLKPYSAVKINVFLSQSEQRSVLESGEILNIENSSLTHEATELAKPIVFKTTHFGDLEYDKSINWFRGKAVFNGNNVNIDFEYNNQTDLKKGLNIAEILWKNQLNWKINVENELVKEFLPLKNESWLDDEEQEITETHFRDSISLESITFEGEDNLTFWYSDGDMFGCHTLVASANINLGVQEVNMMG